MRVTEQAIAGATGGQSAARQMLAELFDSEFDALYRFCLARTGEPAMADDAASEAFLAASRVIADGRGADVSRRWLFVVARRRIVDQWRSRERQRRRVERLTRAARDEWFSLLPADDDSETVDRVVAVLSSLPDRQRAALALRYLDDYSVAEVAEHLELSYQAAESLLARARRGFTASWEAQS